MVLAHRRSPNRVVLPTSQLVLRPANASDHAAGVELMQGLAAGIGLYSIGVRGATIPELAVWAARCQIPFLHLRGGARGCAATRQTAQELDRWRAIADATAPVKLLTADLTLHDLIQPHEQRRRTAERELERTAET